MTVKPYQEPPADTSDLPKRLEGQWPGIQLVRAIATEARQSSSAKKLFFAVDHVGDHAGYNLPTRKPPAAVPSPDRWRVL